jgi:large subunit ribosomal protein L29
MKIKDIRQKDTEHLRQELGEQQKQLFTLRTQAVTEKLEDPSQLRKARKSIARIKTVMHQRAMEKGKEPAKEAPAPK